MAEDDGLHVELVQADRLVWSGRRQHGGRPVGDG